MNCLDLQKTQVDDLRQAAQVDKGAQIPAAIKVLTIPAASTNAVSLGCL